MFILQNKCKTAFLQQFTKIDTGFHRKKLTLLTFYLNDENKRKVLQFLKYSLKIEVYFRQIFSSVVTLRHYSRKTSAHWRHNVHKRRVYAYLCLHLHRLDRHVSGCPCQRRYFYFSPNYPLIHTIGFTYSSSIKLNQTIN